MINRAQILKKLEPLNIDELSITTGFQLRKDAKISAQDYVIGFLTMVNNGQNTLVDWVRAIGLQEGPLVSPQALQGKLQFRQVKFAEQLLHHTLEQGLTKQAKMFKTNHVFGSFARVFLEDSSCLHLRPELEEFFRGSKNQHGSSATAKIQLTVELHSGQYTQLALQSFRDNDQKYAAEICTHLQAGDLVIRDMGYAVLSAFQQIIDKGAYFLSRLKYGTHLYDPNSGEQIQLHKKLQSLRHKGLNTLDIEVWVGKKQKLPCRLVANRVPVQVEQKRKRKANKDRAARANHSEHYMELLGWNIMITNIEPERLSVKQALQAYACRWYIEIVFKCWKSELKLANFFPEKKSMIPPRVIITFYLLLVWVTMFYARWYHFFLIKIAEIQDQWLSPMQFARFVKTYFIQLVTTDDLEQYTEVLAKHYCYAKRKDRTNMMQSIYMII